MPTFNTGELIDQLRASLRRQLLRTEELMLLPLEQLATAPGPKRWSVLQVVEHLNILGGHYHHRLRAVYATGTGFRRTDTFRSGPWGERLTRTMQPREGGRIPWRMRTLGRFEPEPASGSSNALTQFTAMLVDLDRMLVLSRSTGLDGPRITSTLGPLFRFKPGDAFRFTIAHNERHFLQIERTLADLHSAS